MSIGVSCQRINLNLTLIGINGASNHATLLCRQGNLRSSLSVDDQHSLGDAAAQRCITVDIAQGDIDIAIFLHRAGNNHFQIQRCSSAIGDTEGRRRKRVIHSLRRGTTDDELHLQRITRCRTTKLQCHRHDLTTTGQARATGGYQRQNINPLLGEANVTGSVFRFPAHQITTRPQFTSVTGRRRGYRLAIDLGNERCHRSINAVIGGGCKNNLGQISNLISTYIRDVNQRTDRVNDNRLALQHRTTGIGDTGIVFIQIAQAIAISICCCVCGIIGIKTVKCLDIIGDAVAITIRITDVADIVTIQIRLIGVGVHRAVVFIVGNTISISILQGYMNGEGLGICTRSVLTAVRHPHRYRVVACSVLPRRPDNHTGSANRHAGRCGVETPRQTGAIVGIIRIGDLRGKTE